MPGTADFLRHTCASLLVALAHADDAGVVAHALQGHAAAHGAWLHAIASAPTGDATAALADLYELHGRVAGRLEHQCPFPLPPAIEAAVRQMLADELSTATNRALAALEDTRTLIPA